MKCLECHNKADYAGCCSKHSVEKVEKATRDTKLISVKPSTDSKHKYVATFEVNGREKHVPFGAAGMNDFILYSKKDKELAEERRDLFWERHLKDMKTHDVTKPGFLSLFILWNKPTLKASIADYKKRFNL